MAYPAFRPSRRTTSTDRRPHLSLRHCRSAARTNLSAQGDNFGALGLSRAPTSQLRHEVSRGDLRCPRKVSKAQSRVGPSRARDGCSDVDWCARLLLTGGCAVGPDYFRPDLGLPAGYLPGDEAPAVKNDAQRFFEARSIPAQWWRVFSSDKINHLVEMAFAQNPSVGEAIAALEQARWNVRAQEGAFFPQVTGEWVSTRQKLAAPEGCTCALQGRDLHASHAAGECRVPSGRVGQEPARRRSPDVGGGRAVLPAGGNLSHACGEHHRGCHSRSGARRSRLRQPAIS